jgi:hypothetical protein
MASMGISPSDFKESMICGICEVHIPDDDSHHIWLSDTGSFAHSSCLGLVSALESELDKVKGKCTGGKMHMHARIRLFCRSFGTTLAQCLLDVAPSKIATTVMLEKLVSMSIVV